MKVHIYRNLHKNCWSVRYKGKVIEHLDSLILEDCTYHVQKAGHEKVLKEKRKNVHAYVKGEIIARHIEKKYLIKASRIVYNPYKLPYFYKESTNGKMESSKLLYFSNNGKLYEIA